MISVHRLFWDRFIHRVKSGAGDMFVIPNGDDEIYVTVNGSPSRSAQHGRIMR